MAPIFTNLTNSRSNTDANQYVTASVTVPANLLGLLVVHVTHGSAVETPSSIVGPGFATWTLITSVTNGATTKRTLIYRCLPSGDRTGTITINFAGTMTSCGWTVSKAEGIDTSGMNGSGAIVQSNTNTEAAVTAGLVTLSAFASSDNAAFGAVQIGANEQPAVGSGFTAIGVNAGTLPNYGSRSEYKTNDPSVDWTWVTSTVYCAVAIEIAAEPPLPELLIIDPTLAAAMRAGEGVPYVWVSFNSNPVATREVMEYRISNNGMEFECKCLDIGTLPINTKITLARGVYVGGTLYTMASPTWFMYYYETTQGVTTLKGFAFFRTEVVLDADVTVSALLTDLLDDYEITASLPSEYPKTAKFAPTGSKIYLSTMGDILSHLARKYFMSAFARENAVIWFRSMGYAAVNKTPEAYSIPSDAIVTVKNSLRVVIALTWVDETGTRQYNYTPPAAYPVQDCGYIETTIADQTITDSSEDRSPQFEFICRPDFTLQNGSFLQVDSYDAGFVEVEEYFKRGKKPVWHQIVRDLPWRPITAAAGHQLHPISQDGSKLGIDASRFTTELSAANQSIQSALETLDKHTH